MESSEQNSAYISPPICSNRLIFNFPETNIGKRGQRKILLNLKRGSELILRADVLLRTEKLNLRKLTESD